MSMLEDFRPRIINVTRKPSKMDYLENIKYISQFQAKQN